MDDKQRNKIKKAYKKSSSSKKLAVSLLLCIDAEQKIDRVSRR